MRIQNEQLTPFGQSAVSGSKETQNKSGKAIFMGNKEQDPIEERKKQAREKAMKLVKDTFQQDKAIDDDIENRRNRIVELQDEIKAAQKDLAMAKESGVAEDQKAAQKKLGDLKNEFGTENAIIRGVKIERLKTHSMVDAQAESKEVLKDAGKEILGMLTEEGTEHVDEVQKEEKEQAEEKAEKEKEQEEKLRSEKEKKEEAVEVPTEEFLQMNQLQEQVQTEIAEIVDKMKLVAEDIKGAAVDANV